jgi:transcription elongation factor GreA
MQQLAPRAMEAGIDHDTAHDVRADIHTRGAASDAAHPKPDHVAETLDVERHAPGLTFARGWSAGYFPEVTGARPLRPGAPVFRGPNSATLMIEELKAKLGEEVEKLQYELNVTLPNEIRKAVELGDLRENSEYKAALERQSFVQARLGQLRERLSKLASIDMAQIPTDKVGLGSKVVVQDEKTGSKETYNLVFGDALEFDESQVTMASPIGRALLGKSKGEVAYLRLPTMVRQLKVLDLRTIHDQQP